VLPPSPSSPPSTGPQRRLTGYQARRATKQVLARRNGRAFRRGRGYTAACVDISLTRWTCNVRWRYGRFLYKGKVALRLRSDGRIATRIVLRRTTAKKR
jgi:hypothetical protein